MKAMLFLIVGIVLMLVAAGLAFGTARFLGEAPRADGVVTALNAGGSHPQIRFVTTNGQLVSYPQGGWIAGYRVGDRVGVRYRPAAPAATARIEAFGAMWAWPTALAVLGAVFALLGLMNRFGGR